MRIASLFLLYLLPNLLGAQRSVSLRFIDAQSEQPVAFVEVWTEESNRLFRADSAGTMSIPLQDSLWVQIYAFGYEPQMLTLHQELGQSIEIRLKPKTQNLAEVEVNTTASALSRLGVRKIEGTLVYAGKKSERIEIDALLANLASDNARQALARVPGLNVWESDAAGIQLGIGARGLSPDRSSNFNTRQNGYDMAADALGYPESYYAPPLQALERIDFIRGAASLQYGTQFGGLVNLVMKKGDPDKRLALQSYQTANSLGHFDSYTALGGQLSNTNYRLFLDHRFGQDFRPNSNFRKTTAYAFVEQQWNSKWSSSLEYTHMNYLAQQPGGLTDVQFQRNPYASFRSRNWFAVDWNLFALKANYTFSPQVELHSVVFGLLGSRDALGNLSSTVRQDSRPFSNRDLMRDTYKNWGVESRGIWRYELRDKPQALVSGLRYYKGFTQKTQGFGSAGEDADFSFVREDRKLLSDYDFPSENLAFFSENVFNLSDRLSLTPGLRIEHIRTRADGFYDSSVRIPLTGEIVIDSITTEQRDRRRNLLLLGLGMSYQLRSNLELYANATQNYRAITFNNLRVVSPAFAVDPNLHDESGYTLDLGLRGSPYRGLLLDGGFFYLSYSDRIGSVLTAVQDNLGNTRILRYTTNVADAYIFGLEYYGELDIHQFLEVKSPWNWVVFSNLALTEARYYNSNENGVEGNRVETVPLWNVKAGLRGTWKSIQAQLQFTYLSDQYSEASNAEFSGDGLVGLIPAYSIWDLTLGYKAKWWSAQLGCNNLFNAAYFTRRATGYPGPGIIPSAPRNFYLGLGLQL